MSVPERGTFAPLNGSTPCYNNLPEFNDALEGYERGVASRWREGEKRERDRRKRRAWLAGAAIALRMRASSSPVKR